MSRATMTQADLDAYKARGRRVHEQTDAGRMQSAQCLSAPDEIDEERLQSQCERELVLIGYKRMTAMNATDHAGTCRGWFGHLHEARGNPLMPDLWIFAAGRVLCIELKRRNRYQPGQREMIAAGEWLECRTLDEFRAAVEEWERENDATQKKEG